MDGATPLHAYQIDSSQSNYEQIRKQILELAIRSRFYVPDIYHMVYGEVYPPHLKTLGATWRVKPPPRVCEPPVVVINDDRVVGFCIYTLEHHELGPKMHIERLLVDESHRYEGIGTILINKLKTDLIPITTVSTPQACRFYVKQGFIPIPVPTAAEDIMMMYIIRDHYYQHMKQKETSIQQFS